jgi:dihydroxyacetone kinase-like predicted kinase
VTGFVGDAKVGDRAVPQGAYMGFLDGELFAVEDTVGKTALKLAEKMLEEANVLTLLRGDGLDDEMLHEIVDSIRELDEAVEVEIRDGGQPLYPLQMVAE